MEVDRTMEIDDVDDPGLLLLYRLPDLNIPSCSISLSELNSSHADLRDTSMYIIMKYFVS